MSTMKLNKFELIMWKTSNLIVPGASNVKSKYKRPWAGKSQLAVIPQLRKKATAAFQTNFSRLMGSLKGNEGDHLSRLLLLQALWEAPGELEKLGPERQGRQRFQDSFANLPQRTSLSGQDEEPGFIFPRKPGKREPFWRNCLHQTGLEASLWGILLDQQLVCKGSAHCVWWRKWGANAQDGGPELYKNSS